MHVRHGLTAAATAASVLALGLVAAAPAQAAEYSSALKIKGVQYDAPGGTPTSAPVATPRTST